MNSASLHTDDPIVNVSHLQKAKFYLGSKDCLVLSNGLIKVTTQLEQVVSELMITKFWQMVFLRGHKPRDYYIRKTWNYLIKLKWTYEK